MPGLEEVLKITGCLEEGYNIETIADIAKGAKCRMFFYPMDERVELKEEVKEKTLTVILRLKGEKERSHILRFEARDRILGAMNIHNEKNNIKITVEEEPL